MKHIDASSVISTVETMSIGQELQYRQLADSINELAEETEHKKFVLVLFIERTPSVLSL